MQEIFASMSYIWELMQFGSNANKRKL